MKKRPADLSYDLFPPEKQPIDEVPLAPKDLSLSEYAKKIAEQKGEGRDKKSSAREELGDYN